MEISASECAIWRDDGVVARERDLAIVLLAAAAGPATARARIRASAAALRSAPKRARECAAPSSILSDATSS